MVTSSAKTNRIARHKSLTYEALKGFDFCPRLFGRSDPSLQFPRFLKPDDGQGGKRAYRADTPDELAFLLSRHPDLLVMEYLPGDELSVDCFSDYCGQLLFIGPRTRERVQMGISFRSTAVPLSDEVRRIAQVIHDSFQLDGAWFFQVKQDAQGRFKLLEFAPRQSSTMGLYRHAGVNFALLSLFNALRIPVTIRRNDYALQLDRCLHNRFRSDLVYRRVYIDFDETIVDGERVHGRVMDYLYQCRNNGIEIVLLTKHRQDLGETLRRCAIAESLFHRTVQLANDEDKSDHIDPRDAIFIDNYWRDRRAVSAKLGIPVFDVDAIECLMR
ncbi:MAG: ATP-grasp domain-containing protein [Accumulibacter sp.]